MSVFTLSKDFNKESFTLLDNRFITSYLPDSDGTAIKVYLYGLYLVNVQSEDDLESICSILDIDIDEFVTSIEYWEEMGLMEIVSRSPFSVRYLPIVGGFQPGRKYSASKYSDFNQNMQELFPTRMLSTTEYNEYYYFLETSKMDPMALYLISQYCVKLKGTSCRYPYILSVAKDWSQSGIKSVDQVESRLSENEEITREVVEVFATLKKKSSPDLTDKQLYIKWTKSWGFDHNAILLAAKLTHSSSIEKLDLKLDEFFKLGLFSTADITEYQSHKDELYDISKSITGKLSVYYQTHDYIIEVYISPWLKFGYDKSGLELIAHNCFINNVRTLEGMNFEVNKLYNLGVISFEAVKRYYEQLTLGDKCIKAILDELGNTRMPNRLDREMYQTWTKTWGFPDGAIIALAKIAKLKSQSLAYLNNLLAKCKESNLFTEQDILSSDIAKLQLAGSSNKSSSVATNDESVFSDIDNLEV